MKERYSELIPLHDALKEIVKDFNDICNRANVSFYLFYGTMLGAARHHDIIPWDDDIDLAMMREDYENLIKYFLDNKETGYDLFCAETNYEHTQIFAKLVRIDGKYDYLSNYYTHARGLSIDIFPLDEAKKQSDFQQIIRGKWILYLRRVVNSRAKLNNPEYKESGIRRFARKILVLPFLRIDNHRLLVYTNDLCKKNNGRGYPNIISYSTTDHLYQENDSKDVWVPATTLPLGDAYYRVPGNYSHILEHLYGSRWNEMPPERLREQHTHV